FDALRVADPPRRVDEIHRQRRGGGFDRLAQVVERYAAVAPREDGVRGPARLDPLLPASRRRFLLFSFAERAHERVHVGERRVLAGGLQPFVGGRGILRGGGNRLGAVRFSEGGKRGPRAG